MTDSTAPQAAVLHMVIREEAPEDILPIEAVTCAAFHGHPFSRQTEHLIVRGLRDAGALRLSLVATLDGQVVGHAALSPVRIGAQDLAWCGLGPVSVAPAHQRSGIGSALVRSGLRRLVERGVAGCVVLGDPAFYTRFGFSPQTGLVVPGAPAAHFMALALAGTVPAGVVTYHAAFSSPGC
jgi:predicted N-acetyltransferase YhbS